MNWCGDGISIPSLRYVHDLIGEPSQQNKYRQRQGVTPLPPGCPSCVVPRCAATPGTSCLSATSSCSDLTVAGYGRKLVALLTNVPSSLLQPPRPLLEGMLQL